jgi:hypothetical protein
VVDPLMFVETSSYGCRAVDSVLRVLGVDMLVAGSDRPYAEPHPDLGLGAAARHAIRVTNPARLLRGDQLADGDQLSAADRDLTARQMEERSDREDHFVAAHPVSRPA